jgi:hypothetical protein
MIFPCLHTKYLIFEVHLLLSKGSYLIIRLSSV